MQRAIRAHVLLTLILCACTINAPTPQPPPVSTTGTAPASPTPTIPTGEQSCGYQWAQQDLPELSTSLQASIQELPPEAQANAFAFGENCILPDGSIARFLPMETDFNIILTVTDVTDERALGEWIVKVMQVIENIPADQIVGPRPGRVSMTFLAGGNQSVVNFYIDQYQRLPSGLSSAEIYRSLRTPP